MVLVGCEETQEVCKAFRDRGVEAYSCDLLPCSGGHPEWHLQMDVFDAIDLYDWKIGIFHPPCDYLTVSGNRWFNDQPKRASGVLVGEERRLARERAVIFFMKLYDCKIPKVAVENPIGIMSSRFRKPDQVIQPWMFGHPESKATCLWLKGLPPLQPTDNVRNLFLSLPKTEGQRIFHLPNNRDRKRLRSATFPGIAAAMAEQWAI